MAASQPEFRLDTMYYISQLSEVSLTEGQVLLIRCQTGYERKWCHHYAQSRGWHHDVFIITGFEEVTMFKCHECNKVYYEKETNCESDGRGDAIWYCPNNDSGDDERSTCGGCYDNDPDAKSDNTMTHLGSHFPNAVGMSPTPFTIRQRKWLRRGHPRDTTPGINSEKPVRGCSLEFVGDEAFKVIDELSFIITEDIKKHLRGKHKNRKPQ